MLGDFSKTYKSCKSRWVSIVDQASKGVVKDALNHIIWSQHILSLDPSEWGELSDLAGLDDKFLAIHTKESQNFQSEFEKIIQSLESTLKDLYSAHSRIPKDIKLKTTTPEKLNDYLLPLMQSYEKELEFRKKLLQNFSSYIDAPYDVIATVSSAWSGRPYTSERFIDHYEKFLDFETGQ